MSGGNRLLLFLVSAGMELSYSYACLNFGTVLLFHRTFPFAESVGAFLLAALLTLVAWGKGWRIITVVALHALGFLPAAWRLLDVLNSWSGAFNNQTLLSPDWFVDAPFGPAEYFTLVLFVAWALVFWGGGVELARRPRDYATVCSRFDRGLIAFFVLFLVRFYLQAGLGIAIDETLSGFLIIPFLIFALVAIALVRHTSTAHRDFIPGYQTLGVVLGFGVVILLVGTGLAFFCLPLLTFAAEKGNDVLNLLSVPLVSVLLMIWNWIFGTDWAASGQALPPAQQSQTPAGTWNLPGWLEPLARIAAAGVGIIVALVLLAIVVGLLYAILRRLFSRTAYDPEQPGARQILSDIGALFRALALFLWGGLVRSAMGNRGAIALYSALRGWGRSSGAPHFTSETPAEYGLRLEHRFPTLAGEIESIVQAFQREVYRESVLSEQELATARSAWGRLTSPSQWSLRVKASLTQGSIPDNRRIHGVQ